MKIETTLGLRHPKSQACACNLKRSTPISSQQLTQLQLWQPHALPPPAAIADFDFGTAQLMKLVKKCHFPWLMANVVDAKTSEP